MIGDNESREDKTMPMTENPIVSLKNYSISSPLQLCPETVDILLVTGGQLTALLPSLPEFTLAAGDVIILEPGSSLSVIPGGQIMSGGHMTFGGKAASGAQVTFGGKAASGAQVTHLCLGAGYVEHFLGTATAIRCNSALEPGKDYERLRSQLLGIAYLYSCDAAQNRLELLSMCFGLLAEIKKHFSIAAGITLTQNHAGRTQEIARFIEAHYPQSLTLSALAREFFLSPQYLSRFFAKHFQKGFNAYLMEVRLKHARRDLVETDLDMTQIAVNNGFGSPAAFTKAFKKHFGQAPTAYRKNERQRPGSSYADFEENRDPLSPADSAAAARIIHAELGTPENAPRLTSAFTSLINAGHAMNFLDNDFLQQFRQAHGLLHFCYVRLEHLISSAVIPTLAESGRHVFGNAHRILDILHEMNLIPLIELGRTPPVPFAGAQPAGAQPSVQNPRFRRLLEAFLEDARHRYGLSWVGRWKFELWQPEAGYTGAAGNSDGERGDAADENTAAGAKGGESAHEYARRFQEIRAVIKQYIPSADVGGPGFNTSLPPEQLWDTLKALKVLKIQPDFISTAFYAMEYVNGAMALCTDPRRLQERFDRLTQGIGEIFGQPIPLYATKLNLNVTENTLINDSCFQGAFLIDMMLTAKKYCELTGFWTLSDITGLLPARESFRSTGPGLFRKNGIPKPAYYALAFLNQLGSYAIARGPGYILTASQPGDYRLLIYHYSDLSYAMRLQYPSMTSLDDVARLFEKAMAPAADYVLEQLPPGTYCIRRRHLDYIHGSILDIDTQGFSHSNLTEEDYLIHAMNISADDLYHLKASCVPETRTIYVRAKESLTLKVRPQNNSLYLFEIMLEPEFS